MKKLLLPLCLIGLTFAETGTAQTTTWTGATDNDWNTSGNWDNGLPNTVPNTVIDADGADVTMSAAANASNILISGTGAVAPTLNITENLTASSLVRVGSNSAGSNFRGSVNHAAGTFTTSSALLIGAGAGSATSGNEGTYTFGGTELDAPTVAAGSVRLGDRVGETGSLALNDYGTFGTTNNLDLSLFNGSSTFSVSGGDLSINVGGDMRMSFSGGGSVTVSATLTSSGFSTINVGGDVLFDTGSGGNNTDFSLALDGYTGALNDTIVVIDAATFSGFQQFGNVADGDTLAIDGYEFLADYDTANGDFSLVVTAVPEPSSGMLLVGTFLFAAYKRTRHSRK